MQKRAFNEIISKKLINIIKNKNWYRHGIYRDNILVISSIYPYLGGEFFAREWLDKGLSNIIRIDGQAYITENEFNELSELMFRKIQREKNYLSRYVSAYNNENQKVISVAKKIARHKFKNLSNEQLSKLFSDFHKASTKLMHWLYSMEFLNPAVEKYVKIKIKEWMPEWSEKQISEFLTSISYFPQKLPFQEELEFLIGIKQGKFKMKKMLKFLHKKYCWMNLNMWEGLPYTFEEYVSRIDKMLNDKKLIEEVKNRKEKVEESQRKISGIKNDEIKNIIKTIQELIYLKTYRIDVFSKSWFTVLELIDEICLRLKMSYDELLHLTAEEIVFGLKGKKISLKEIRKRDRAAICRIDNKVYYFYGRAFTEISRILSKIGVSDATKIRGIVAYKGIVRGKARILMTDRDLPKIRKNDILVANLTNPNYNPAFEKISAVITDEGGILCHSAIMAREFTLPCIIGTKIATKVLKDDDFIEVDANKGIVRILRRKSKS